MVVDALCGPVDRSCLLFDFTWFFRLDPVGREGSGSGLSGVSKFELRFGAAHSAITEAELATANYFFFAAFFFAVFLATFFFAAFFFAAMIFSISCAAIAAWM